MATQTITAMFDRYDDASEAVGKLEAAGVPHSAISIVSNDASQRDRHTAASGTTTKAGDGTETGTGTGASLGTMLGGGAGLLAGLGMLAIPGVGPVVAAGWLASTLVGAGAGAATGGVIGALTGAGVDESHAHGYAEGISRGGTLVTVRAESDLAAKVTDILDDEGTIEMGGRESAWRKEGWTGRYAGGGDYAPGTTGAMSSDAVGAAASTTTGLGTGGMSANPTGRNPLGGDSARSRVRSYPMT